jgi:hypothetical protein
MPTNRRRRRPGRRLDVETLTPEMLRALASGGSFFRDETTEDVRAAWEQHAEWLLEAWIERHPGSRPFGWYLCVGVPEFGERRALENAMWPPCLDKGRHGIANKFTIPPSQEPEVEYLRRHSQLGDDEEAALARGEGVQRESGYPFGGLDALEERAKEEGLLAED